MRVFLAGLLGSSQAGLTTVGYTVKNNLGVEVAPRTTLGVIDLGGGTYGVNLDLDDNSDFVIIWDNGGTPIRRAFSIVDTRTSSISADLEVIDNSIQNLKTEVQGLKEKNQRRTANNPVNPSVIQVDIKKDSAPDWSLVNLQEQYQINIDTDSNGDVIRYGGN